MADLGPIYTDYLAYKIHLEHFRHFLLSRGAGYMTFHFIAHFSHSQKPSIPFVQPLILNERNFGCHLTAPTIHTKMNEEQWKNDCSRTWWRSLPQGFQSTNRTALLNHKSLNSDAPDNGSSIIHHIELDNHAHLNWGRFLISKLNKLSYSLKSKQRSRRVRQ